MRHQPTISFVAATALLVFGATGCEEGAGVGPDQTEGTVTVTMSEGSSGASASLSRINASIGETGVSAARVPESAVDSVKLAINEVQVLRFEGSASPTTSGQQGGWISLDVQGGTTVIDLLNLPSDGAGVTIGSGQLDAGDYHNVRLFFEDAWIVLGEPVTLGGGGQGKGQGGKTFEAGRHDLFIPSGEETGVKIPTARFTVDSDGAAVNVLADTDASIQNINATGRGLLMTPVLTAETDEGS